MAWRVIAVSNCPAGLETERLYATQFCGSEKGMGFAAAERLHILAPLRKAAGCLIQCPQSIPEKTCGRTGSGCRPTPGKFTPSWEAASILRTLRTITSLHGTWGTTS